MKKLSYAIAAVALLVLLTSCQTLRDISDAIPEQTQAERQTARQAREDRRMRRRLEEQVEGIAEGLRPIAEYKSRQKPDSATTGD